MENDVARLARKAANCPLESIIHWSRIVSRLNAAAIHLAISLVLALTIGAILYFLWFPPPHTDEKAFADSAHQFLVTHPRTRHTTAHGSR
ncbi:MAG: hypothetical protein RSP_22630 [Rhodanobacter sp.]